ncbi:MULTISPECIES: acireductone synthase [unclassified Shewanella]|uniref:acireductone synthase n=1 Tax=unclassified Shewanella TaxID=196818 RepID=UPI0009704CFC|nr:MULTISPECIES: acireductone synthase [unclassified Shewanella]MDO6619684.1 acireductone synthase [Shewanella sp. 6_MG-2023]MDO6640639.1 acireductone synthase [Shewanella sp. 5_MG-2023]MDO6678772.1 acireductone synthase [Shewanella sp. 4_MG-2023]MDO6775788.1 acireductone synthase [Shewanella sp. 3_MG-2023]PMG29171.1 2,3-diketo-5-methylthio-1-phosphopentane phosphatase [Shewanella sp. 10N.286.52.C2]
MGIRAIIVDTAGTTTDLDFIQDVLFPYSKKAMGDFLAQNQHNPLVEYCISDVRDLALEADASIERVTEILSQWIDEDRKATPLKTLQGLIWKQGYAANEFTGHIYPDFIDAMPGLEASNIRLYSFSSGSAEAQKLLFSHSDAGDLTPKFSGHFDTRTGNKLDKQAYCNILNTISLSPKQVLFISDVVEELKAAEAAGLHTRHMVRFENQKTAKFAQIKSFAELTID